MDFIEVLQTISSKIGKQKQQIKMILERVAQFFRQNGHFVKTLPLSLLI